MQIQKNIYFFGEKEKISVVYTNDRFKAGDTQTAIYDKYKISILLSDGIKAVMHNSLLGGEKYNVLFFRPNEIHFGNISKDGIYAYLDILIPITFFCKFTHNSEITNFLTDKKANRRNCLHFNFENQSVVSKISSDIIDLIKSDSPLDDIKLFSLILQIVILCSDFYEVEKSKPLNCNIPELVLKVMHYISENYEKKISVKELALMSKCSVVYLSKMFKYYTNMTIYSYITTIRISKAQILLKEGKNVTETCFLCGFNDCSNFINKFKRIVGQTPSYFKKHINTDNV